MGLGRKVKNNFHVHCAHRSKKAGVKGLAEVLFIYVDLFIKFLLKVFFLKIASRCLAVLGVLIEL